MTAHRNQDMASPVERLSDRHYRQLIDLANDSIFIIDAEDAVILDVNRQAETLTGYEKVELVGMKVFALHPETERAAARRLFEAVVREGTGAHIRIRVERKDGEHRIIDVSAALVALGEKTVIQRICRDVTEQALLEVENRRFREYYEHILNSMPVGLGVKKRIDRDGDVVFENDKLRTLFSGDHQCEKSWLKEGIGDDAADEIAMIDGNYAVERVFPNGRAYRFTRSYFMDQDDDWCELSIVQDVSERRALQQALVTANEELERRVEERTQSLREKQAQLIQSEKMATIGQLAAGVAHEINTPLGALKSNNDLFIRLFNHMQDLLAQDPAAEHLLAHPKLARMLTKIEKLNKVNQTAAGRIVRIVNGLRHFARLDQAVRDTVDIHAGIENTLTLVHHELKNRIQVVREFGDLPAVRCYPDRLNQVFLNLIVNASQAIEGQGTLFIKTYQEGRNIYVAFTDTGNGIPAADLERLFEAGYTTKSAGIGTGLGLSIVRQIMDDHEGDITVESKLGAGSTFRIRLPLDT